MFETVFVERALEAVVVRITEQVKKDRDAKVAVGQCLGCGRTKKSGERFRTGLCATCYLAVRRAVQARKVSKKDLIRDGKMLPPGKPGRKPSNAFSRELSER